MSFFRLLALCSVTIAVSPAVSGDPVPKPMSEPAPAAPAPPAAVPEQILPSNDPAPSPPIKPLLLPDQIPPMARPPELFIPPALRNEQPPESLAPKASEMEIRIRYQKARNIAETDGKVRAAWEESRTARTDDGKRQALQRYQALLFAKMLSMDRGIAPLVEERRKAGKPLLEQTRVAPTVPKQ